MGNDNVDGDFFLPNAVQRVCGWFGPVDLELVNANGVSSYIVRGRRRVALGPTEEHVVLGVIQSAQSDGVIVAADAAGAGHGSDELVIVLVERKSDLVHLIAIESHKRYIAVTYADGVTRLIDDALAVDLPAEERLSLRCGCGTKDLCGGIADVLVAIRWSVASRTRVIADAHRTKVMELSIKRDVADNVAVEVKGGLVVLVLVPADELVTLFLRILWICNSLVVIDLGTAVRISSGTIDEIDVIGVPRPARVHDDIRIGHGCAEIKLGFTGRIRIPTAEAHMLMRYVRLFAFIFIQWRSVLHTCGIKNVVIKRVNERQGVRFQSARNVNLIFTSLCSVRAICLFSPEFWSSRIAADVASRVLIQVVTNVLLTNGESSVSGIHRVYQLELTVRGLVVIVNGPIGLRSAAVEVASSDNTIGIFNVTRVAGIASFCEVVARQKNCTVLQILVLVPVIGSHPYAALQRCLIQTGGGFIQIPAIYSIVAVSCVSVLLFAAGQISPTITTPTMSMSLFTAYQFRFTINIEIHRADLAVVIDVQDGGSVTGHGNRAGGVLGARIESLVGLIRIGSCGKRLVSIGSNAFALYVIIGLGAVLSINSISHLLLPIDNSHLGFLGNPFRIHRHVLGQGVSEPELARQLLAVIPAGERVARPLRIRGLNRRLALLNSLRSNVGSAVRIEGHVVSAHEHRVKGDVLLHVLNRAYLSLILLGIPTDERLVSRGGIDLDVSLASVDGVALGMLDGLDDLTVDSHISNIHGLDEFCRHGNRFSGVNLHVGENAIRSEAELLITNEPALEDVAFLSRRVGSVEVVTRLHLLGVNGLPIDHEGIGCDRWLPALSHDIDGEAGGGHGVALRGLHDSGAGLVHVHDGGVGLADARAGDRDGHVLLRLDLVAVGVEELHVIRGVALQNLILGQSGLGGLLDLLRRDLRHGDGSALGQGALRSADLDGGTILGNSGQGNLGHGNFIGCVWLVCCKLISLVGRISIGLIVSSCSVLGGIAVGGFTSCRILVIGRLICRDNGAIGTRWGIGLHGAVLGTGILGRYLLGGSLVVGTECLVPNIDVREREHQGDSHQNGDDLAMDMALGVGELLQRTHTCSLLTYISRCSQRNSHSRIPILGTRI